MNLLDKTHFLRWPAILDIYFQMVDTKSRPESADYLRTVLSDAHLFLLGGELEAVDLSNRTGLEPLDLPFRTCVFECFDDRTMDVQVIGAAYDEIRFDFIGAHEYSPQSYFYFGFGCTTKNSQKSPPRFFFCYDDYSSLPGHKPENIAKSFNLSKIMRVRLNISLDLLNRKSSAVGRVIALRPKLKVKIQGIKHFIKFKPITIIRSKEPTSYFETEVFSKKIDWSHRWEVRGHWRRIDGLGKNRDGEYLIQNFTWVKSHIKGPEDAVLIKTTRIIQD